MIGSSQIKYAIPSLWLGQKNKKRFAKKVKGARNYLSQFSIHQGLKWYEL